MPATTYLLIERLAMINPKITSALLVTACLFAGEASAKGCLAGAAVGGAAGHVAGHHSLIGAGIGCAVGRHRANKKDKEAAAAAANQQVATSRQQTPAPARPGPAK
jgi:hypothetical protein